MKYYWVGIINFSFDYACCFGLCGWSRGMEGKEHAIMELKEFFLISLVEKTKWLLLPRFADSLETFCPYDVLFFFRFI